LCLILLLFQNLDDNSMTDECEDRLLEIQYFMSREWSMDPKLVRACDVDVKALYVYSLRVQC
jgi:Golgi apparatus protein 1